MSKINASIQEVSKTPFQDDQKLGVSVNNAEYSENVDTTSLLSFKIYLGVFILLMACFASGVSILVFSQYKVSQMKQAKPSHMLVVTPAQGIGLGQCHWVGGPFDTNNGIKLGYSSSTYFNFTDGGGDSWAAIEPRKGEYYFTQQRNMVNNAKSKNKAVMLQIQVADKANKQHNVPYWALSDPNPDNNVETYVSSNCGDPKFPRNYVIYPWDDGTRNSVKPVWNNPTYVDKSEATLLTASNVVTADPTQAAKVKFTTKIAAVWDPKFRELYGNALRALNREFRADMDSGTVQAVQMMSGGESGESVLPPACYGYYKDNNGNACGTPDVLKPDCPTVKSMAKFVQKLHYPQLSVEQVARDIVSKKSNCNPSNTIPGTKVQLCTASDPKACPTAEKGSACFVFDDYYIQAVKQMISMYVEIFSPTPVVWQKGNGMSGTGRTAAVLEEWMDKTYGSKIWMKFNGWGPRTSKMWSSGFNAYANTGAHGYEPDHPNNFSKLIYWKGKEDEGKQSIINAIKEGIVNDKSSYLCLQDTFYKDPVVNLGNGLSSNQYYFNPNDMDPNCSKSEINVAQHGVGFCPGYLNDQMKRNAPKASSDGNALPEATSPASSLPTTIATAKPTPANTAMSTPTTQVNPAAYFVPDTCAFTGTKTIILEKGTGLQDSYISNNLDVNGNQRIGCNGENTSGDGISPSGCQYLKAVSYGSTNEQRGLLKFDISSLRAMQGIKIDKATLTLTAVTWDGTSVSSPNLTLTRLLKPFSVTGATWDEYSTGSSWGQAGAKKTMEPGMDYKVTTTATSNWGPVAADITPLVSSWYSDSQAPNMLDVLVFVTKGKRYFASADYTIDTVKRPQLTITYSCQ